MEITKRFYSLSNMLEKFRTEHINKDPKLNYLPYFKNTRRELYARYIKDNINKVKEEYNTEEKRVCYENSSLLPSYKRGFGKNDEQSQELRCRINQWHRGEMIAFVQERLGG